MSKEELALVEEQEKKDKEDAEKKENEKKKERRKMKRRIRKTKSSLWYSTLKTVVTELSV